MNVPFSSRCRRLALTLSPSPRPPPLSSISLSPPQNRPPPALDQAGLRRPGPRHDVPHLPGLSVPHRLLRRPGGPPGLPQLLHRRRPLARRAHGPGHGLGVRPHPREVRPQAALHSVGLSRLRRALRGAVLAPRGGAQSRGGRARCAGVGGRRPRRRVVRRHLHRLLPGRHLVQRPVRGPGAGTLRRL